MKLVLIISLFSFITYSQNFKQEIIESMDLINKFKVIDTEKYLDNNLDSENLKTLLKLQLSIIKYGKINV